MRSKDVIRYCDSSRILVSTLDISDGYNPQIRIILYPLLFSFLLAVLFPMAHLGLVQQRQPGKTSHVKVVVQTSDIDSMNFQKRVQLTLDP